ncbi:MAG: hypothetical protein AB1341_03665 [Bacillota bacterium]
MGNENRAQQIIISLEENHPVLELDAGQRAEKIRDILDDYFSNGTKMKDSLDELSSKVEMLTARMEVMNEVLLAVKDIQRNINHVQPVLTVVKQGPDAEKENEPSKVTRSEITPDNAGKTGIKFDVDAFLDLG